MTTAILLALATAFVTGATGPHAGARRHDRSDARYLALGRDAAFSSVGAIRTAERHLGSVVLIAPEWVLTAAHVVSTRTDGRTVPFVPESVIVSFGSAHVPVAQIVVHPDYWPSSVPESADVLARKGIDVAMLRLATPVHDVPPAVLAPLDPAARTPAVFVGFGTSGTGQSVVTAPEPAGTRRAGTNIIDQVGGHVGERRIPSFLLVADFDAPGMPELNRTGDDTPTDLEYMPVGGDSGGGVFVRSDDAWHLAGLVATGSMNINGGDERKGIYGSLAYATSVAVIRPWIERLMEAR